MKNVILLFLIIIITFSISCEKEDNKTQDTQDVTSESSYNIYELVGNWTGDAKNSSSTVPLDLIVGYEGNFIGSGIEAQWHVNDDDKISGTGSYVYISGSQLIISSATWYL